MTADPYKLAHGSVFTTPTGVELEFMHDCGRMLVFSDGEQWHRLTVEQVAKLTPVSEEAR